MPRKKVEDDPSVVTGSEEPEEVDLTEEKSKAPSEEATIYAAYVHGENVASIAARLKLEPLEVFEIIKSKEGKLGADSNGRRN